MLSQLQGAHLAMPIAFVFVGMDQDGDKRVSRTEVTAGIPAEWANLQNIGGDQISALELAAWSEQTLGTRDSIPSHLSFDTDIDGAISENEFRIRMEAEFEKLDKNKDGTLDRSELVFQMPTFSRGSRGGGGSGPFLQGGQRGPFPRAEDNS